MAALYIVVPAAGGGHRMQQAIPKQYLPLAGKAIVERSIDALLCLAPASITVALALDDTRFATLDCVKNPLVHSIQGGSSRAVSVLNALHHLSHVAKDDDWVLVHDAARPLVKARDLARLVARLAHHPVGGVLATPAIDTLKQVDEHGSVIKTLAREGIWRALTPQMARFSLLRAAIERCLMDAIDPTDEAMALEYSGYHPLIVEGSADNIKITHTIDLIIAEQLWQQRVSDMDTS